MLGHHTYPPGADNPQYLVTTTHADGVVCHHTGATLTEVQNFTCDQTQPRDTTTYYTVAPGNIDGVHWVPAA